MTKIVYNACHGGFGLSEAAVLRYAEIKGLTVYPERDRYGWLTTYWLVPEDERVPEMEGDAWRRASQEERIANNAKYAEQTFDYRKIDRADPALVQVVEELGSEAASGEHAKLKIDIIPSGSRYRIDEYDGAETVETPDSYDWRVAP